MSRKLTITAVIDPTGLAQPALQKAEVVAKLMGARLHLYCCLSDELEKPARSRSIAHMQDLLTRLSAVPEREGTETRIEVEWNTAPGDAIVAAAARRKSDLVVKSVAKRPPMARASKKISDRTLLRKCHCPMLLIKSSDMWSSGNILAAIKVSPEDETHARVNRSVIKGARQIAEYLQRELHVVVAYRGEGRWFDRQRFADLCGLARNRIHAIEASPSEGIATVAKQIGADIVVIGAIARTDADDVATRHTGEKLVDHIEADVVALPPSSRRESIQLQSAVAS